MRFSEYFYITHLALAFDDVQHLIFISSQHIHEYILTKAGTELSEAIKLSGQVSIMQSLQGLGFVDNIASLTFATYGGNFY